MKFIHRKKEEYYKSIPMFPKIFDAPLHITQNMEIVQTHDLISWRFCLPCNFLHQLRQNINTFFTCNCQVLLLMNWTRG